jgi:hypothetical protein
LSSARFSTASSKFQAVIVYQVKNVASGIVFKFHLTNSFHKLVFEASLTQSASLLQAMFASPQNNSPPILKVLNRIIFETNSNDFLVNFSTPVVFSNQTHSSNHSQNVFCQSISSQPYFQIRPYQVHLITLSATVKDTPAHREPEPNQTYQAIIQEITILQTSTANFSG